jgi:Leucine-rich repeat (LRR) protein
MSDKIGDLTTLQELYLQENKLTSLPPSIGKMEALRKLYLEYNSIEKIPKEIGISIITIHLIFRRIKKDFNPNSSP